VPPTEPSGPPLLVCEFVFLIHEDGGNWEEDRKAKNPDEKGEKDVEDGEQCYTIGRKFLRCLAYS
jgi:hypothetical protein